MRVRYAVTFEFETRPPVTHRGELEVGKSGRAHTCVMRATREAQRVLKPIAWTSMNCVLLERLGTPSESVEDTLDANEDAASGEQDEAPATSPLPE